MESPSWESIGCTGTAIVTSEIIYGPLLAVALPTLPSSLEGERAILAHGLPKSPMGRGVMGLFA